MPEAPVAPWRMSDEQKALIREVSGNDINGLGETEFRRPSIVYWPNDRVFDAIPHGKLCKFMGRHQSPDVRAVFRDTENRAPLALDPVAEARVEASPEELTARAKRFALDNEADLVGVCRLDPDWFLEGDIPDEAEQGGRSGADGGRQSMVYERRH